MFDNVNVSAEDIRKVRDRNPDMGLLEAIRAAKKQAVGDRLANLVYGVNEDLKPYTPEEKIDGLLELLMEMFR